MQACTNIMIPMTVATIKTMAILRAIQAKWNEERFGSPSLVGNDGVGTKVAVVIRIIIAQ